MNGIYTIIVSAGVDLQPTVSVWDGSTKLEEHPAKNADWAVGLAIGLSNRYERVRVVNQLVTGAPVTLIDTVPTTAVQYHIAVTIPTGRLTHNCTQALEAAVPAGWHLATTASSVYVGIPSDTAPDFASYNLSALLGIIRLYGHSTISDTLPILDTVAKLLAK